jgi:hypothetical protein
MSRAAVTVEGMGGRTRRIGPGGLFGQVILSAAVIVACLVVRAVTDVPGLLIVAIAALIVATAGMARITSILLSDGNGGGDGGEAAEETVTDTTPAPRRRARARWTTAGVAAVAGTAVALAIALPHADARATAEEPATAATAGQAVRSFLADSVVDGNAELSCGYLTPAAQQRITLLAGAGQSCRAALNATRPAFGGIVSEGDLHALRLTVALSGGTALVRATPASGRPATFVLQRASAAATDPYRAPRCAWRIAAGETAVLPGARGAGSV